MIEEIGEAFKINFDPQKKYLVYFDDFLGQVAVTNDLLRGMDGRFPPFLKKIKSSDNIRFLMTTRDFILQRAKQMSSKLAHAGIDPNEYVLDVGAYSRTVRARILFNHISFSDLSDVQKDGLLANDFYLKIIDHANFNPRLIQLLTENEYLALDARPIQTVVESVLNNPEELWSVPYRNHISGEGRLIMIALLFAGPRVTRDELEDRFHRLADGLNSGITRSDLAGRFRAAVKELEGSVVAIQDGHFSFSNPGVRDFMRNVAATDDLLPLVLPFLSTFEEVKAAWEMSAPEARKKHELVGLWVSAADRFVTGDGTDPLGQIDFLGNLYVNLESDLLMPIEARAINYLEVAELDGADLSSGYQTLELFHHSTFPDEFRQEGTRKIASKIGDLLKRFGETLELDEMHSITQALISFSPDREKSTQDARDGSEAFLQKLGSLLRECTWSDELEDLRDELNSLLSHVGIPTQRLDRPFEERLDDIYEGGRPSNTGYNWMEREKEQKKASDDHIRSMFSSLR